MRAFGKPLSEAGTKSETRKGEGIICASKREGAPTLSIRDGSGKRWIMPWVHLLHATYTNEDSGERIELVYATHEVVCDGVRLESLVEDFAKFAVEWVKCHDKRYLELCPKGMPFLYGIEVTEKVE